MCGICGVLSKRQDGPRLERMARVMADAMKHRGPDDDGYYCKGPIALGFRRLSIIDLCGGHQPMTNETGTVWVVFNGEIYNYRELRGQLEEKGHIFRTRSDTEVIVHGYEEWGKGALEHLNGMFGLAIWDEKENRLLLARDRLGIKLLYYHLDDTELRFASEARALLKTENCLPEIDASALYLFLRYRYTPSPLTLHKGINKIAAGCCLLVENGAARMERWWNSAPEVDESISYPTAIERISELYRCAVRRHLVSDVPVGLLLSGGIDSALLLALMKENGQQWPTFSVGYGSSYKNDELDLAAETARLFGVENFQVNIDRETFENDLPKVVASLEEPIASASIVPMYHVCRQAREKVKVAFIGQGPDELFGGYVRHIGLACGRYWRALPPMIRLPAKSLLRAQARSETMRRALCSLDIPERRKRYLEVFSLAQECTIAGLFKDDLLGNAPESGMDDCWRGMWQLSEKTDELGGFQFLELRSSLPDELLMYADKLSMAHSLELRVPYLDHTIVEFVESLPSSYKFRWLKGKRIHRAVCRKYLADKIIRRRKKGFAAEIVEAWFRESVSSKLRDYLLSGDSLMYRYLRRDAVEALVREQNSGAANNYKTLFSLSVFEEWLRQRTA